MGDNELDGSVEFRAFYDQWKKCKIYQSLGGDVRDEVDSFLSFTWFCISRNGELKGHFLTAVKYKKEFIALRDSLNKWLEMLATTTVIYEYEYVSFAAYGLIIHWRTPSLLDI